MYCMTVDYPKTEGSEFNFDYYRDRHMPLCAQLFADYGYRGSVLRKAPGKGPGSGDLSWASLDVIFASKEQLQAGLAACGKQVADDVPNYTNVKPRMSFAEIEVAL
ncbi:EthD family reductase [Pseudomaricurvus alcaniphilus]|uniref:EthD family reductase n=1 Tax=Pseudomaricurvus alcaniphilus TaxID=1166482 RepID=UPI0014077C29|nr:EthD family reductase [Pseudomaricurvus alcaniphilus]NHN36578.1 EthD family reductase [Pseudomaricurvus alcaniphilus]